MNNGTNFFAYLTIGLLLVSGSLFINLQNQNTSENINLEIVKPSINSELENNISSDLIEEALSGDLPKTDLILSEWLRSGVEPKGVLKYGNKISILLLVTNDPTLENTLNPLGSFKFGDFNLFWVHTTVEGVKELQQISDNKNVVRIVADITNINLSADTYEPGINIDHLFKSPSPLSNSNAKLIGEPQNFNTRNILGSNYVEDTFGYNGSGTVVNVHDTGIDFGHTALIGTLALDSEGRSAAFDGAGGDFAITNKWSETYYREKGEDDTADFFGPLFSDINNEINVSNYDKLMVWSASNWNAKELKSDLSIPLPETFYVGDIPDSAIGHQFGIVMVHNGIFWNIVPFLSVDSNDDASYDTIYFDWETGILMSGIKLGINSVADYLNNAPFDFSKSPGYTELGNPYLSFDIFGPEDIGSQSSTLHPDGYIDMSIGSFGNVYDVWNVTGRLGKGNPISKGIDETGIGFAFFHDYAGHGSGVAGSIAAQDISYQIQQNSTLFSIQGVAPGTKILGTNGLISISSDIYSMLWIQGYEPNETYVWNFVNDHIANISSNSWGFSEFWDHSGRGDSFVGGYDFYSLFFELLSAPGYLSPDHPGILYVISSGNAGPGYGTGGSPVNPSSILVGATTSSWWRENIDPEDPWYSNQPIDQVIGFSSSGPTTNNYPKLDIVNVGAFDYSVLPSIPFVYTIGDLTFAGGNGTFQLFSGTSEAAPFTAGVLSIIHEAWNDNNQSSISPDIAKIILKSSAVDLGYDVYRQGAGRASAKRAVHLILNGSLPSGEELFLLNSTDAYIKAAERINNAFDYWFDGNFRLTESSTISENSINNPISHPSISVSTSDTVVYGGIISPGKSYTANINLDKVAINSKAYKFEAYYNSTKFSFTTTENYNYHRLSDLFNLTVLKEADFVQLTLTFPYEDFMKSQNAGSFFQLLIGEHIDLDSDGIVDENERSLATFVSNENPVLNLFANSEVIKENAVIIIQDAMFRDDYKGEEIPGASYTIGIRAYKRVIDTGIQISTINNIDYNITIDPQDNQTAGFYQGFIKFNGNNNSYVLAPYTYSVPLQINNYSSNGWSEVGGLTNRPMDNAVFGGIDWSWRESSGDWRFYDLEFVGNSTFANTLAIEVEWTYEGTVLDVFVYDNDGLVIGISDINYIKGGFYNSTPNASPNMQRLLVNVSSYRVGDTLSGDTLSGNHNRYFTIALHATAVSDKAVLLDPLSIRSAWISNNISDFSEPTASIVTSHGEFLLDGIPFTNSTIGLDWTNVTTNPIPEFSNNNLPFDFKISKSDFLHVNETIPSSELMIGNDEDALERIYEMHLIKGMEVSVQLSWPTKESDFDLFLIPENKALIAGNSIISGAATGTNPETANVIIPQTGNYKFVVTYFNGDGKDQEFTLDVIARNIVYQIENALENSIQISLIDLDIIEADYLIESISHGWNTNFKFSQIFRFDAYAPQLNLLNSIPEQAFTGQVSIGYVYDASYYNFTLEKDGIDLVSLVNVTGVQEITIDASLINGYYIETRFNASGIDQFGHSFFQNYFLVRSDDTHPIFLIQPEDHEVLLSQEFNLQWEIEDITGGTYELSINGVLNKIGTWTANSALVLSLQFDTLGTKFISLRVVDTGGNSFPSLVKISVVLELSLDITTDPSTFSTLPSTNPTKESTSNDSNLLSLLIGMVFISSIIGASAIYLKRKSPNN